MLGGAIGSRISICLMRTLLAMFALPLLTGCTSAPPPLGSLPGERVHTFVRLRTGTRGFPLAKEQRGVMFQGHFDNMNRLARAGELLVAGPYGRRKSADDLRGVFVLATDEPLQAQQLAETDPGFQQGEFRFEFTRFGTTADLRAQLAADLAAEDAIVASGRKPQPGEGGRSYVWLWANSNEAAQQVLGGHPKVLLWGRCADGRGLLLLDVVDHDAAQAMLAPVAARLGAHELDEWFGSGLLVELPRRAHAR